MSKGKKYDYWIRSSKFTALTKFSNLFIGVLLFIILARLLGPADFGVWGLFMTISAITEIARISLIRNAYIRFMNQAGEEEHEKLQAAAFVLSGFISLFLAALFLLAAPLAARWLNAPGLEVMLRWYALTIILNTVFAHCEMTLTSRANFRGVSFMYITRQGVLLLLIVACWLLQLELSPAALALFYLFSVVCGTFAGLRLALPYLHWRLGSYRAWIPRLWQFGKFVFGTNISAQLFRSMDNFMIASFISPAAAALYNASNRISNLVDIPSQVLADVAFTRATQLDPTDTASVKRMYEKTVGAILTFSIPALLVLLLAPGLVLRILAGDSFLAAAPILQITAFFGFLLPFLKQYGTMMDACGYPRVNFQTNFLALFLSVLFNILGIHLFGLIGAAVGMAVTYLIIFIVTQRILYKKFGISCWQVARYTGEFYGKLFRLARQYATGKLLPIRA